MIGNVCEDPVVIDLFDLHDSALLYEEEVLPLRPGVLQRVAVDLPVVQELLVLLVQFVGNGTLLGGVFAFIEEVVVVFVLVADLFFEEVLDFL